MILITIDTLRRDHVGCFGANPSPTPNLDRFCRDAVRYDQAITASPITTPSHVSIMTGLIPSRHGVSDFGVSLAASHTTLAQSLKEAGFVTAAFIGAVVLDSNSLAPGLDRGFDIFDHFPTEKKGHWDVVERRAATVVDHAREWLSKNQPQPRFAWIHLYDPHDPYEAPAAFAVKSTAAYDAEIAYADSHIGRVFELLRSQGRYHSALIVVISDHGEGLGEHKENTHGIFLYDSTLRVPLIIKLPAEKLQGSVETRQVSSVDVLPTVLEIAGVKPPDAIDGRTLLHSREVPTSVVISETDYPLRFGWAPLKAARTTTEKFIDAPRPEFYRLDHDPGEKNDHYQPWLPEVQRLRSAVAERRATNPTRTTSSVPQSTVDELKALGYLGNVVGATTASDLTVLADPKDKIEVQNHIHDGVMAGERGALDKAIESLSTALKLDPDSGIVLGQLGEAELRARKYEEAAMHLDAARNKSPDDGNLALHAGEAFYQAGNLPAAEITLLQGLKKVPDSYDARVMLANTYLRQRKTAAAEEQAQAAILTAPKRSAARIVLAEIYVLSGKTAAARRELDAVLKRERSNQAARRLLSEMGNQKR